MKKVKIILIALAQLTISTTMFGMSMPASWRNKLQRELEAALQERPIDIDEVNALVRKARQAGTQFQRLMEDIAEKGLEQREVTRERIKQKLYELQSE